MDSPATQLQSIQAMLASGHRCVRLERHSLLLWGSVGGGLCLCTEEVISLERFPDHTQRAVALLIWLAGWLGGMSWIDHWLTRRIRQRRSEILPFAQAQVTRVWWMLLTLGALATFAMFFHGGGPMIYALWTVLLGLGIFIFGLFSRPLVEWIGLATLLMGVAGLAAGLPMNTSRWLTATAFAVGLPLAGGLSTWCRASQPHRQPIILLAWLVAVIMPALLAARFIPLAMAPTAATPTLVLPAGSVVPLRIELDSPLLEIATAASLPMRTLRRVELALTDGQPDGRYRFEDGGWHVIKEGVLALRIDRVNTRLAQGEPEVVVHGDFIFHGEQ